MRAKACKWRVAFRPCCGVLLWRLSRRLPARINVSWLFSVFGTAYHQWNIPCLKKAFHADWIRLAACRNLPARLHKRWAVILNSLLLN